MSESYLHGYSKKEQKRLIEQAKFLEPWVYEHIDLSKAKSILEVGCGVGAQTEILLKRWPKAEITAVDISPTQIAVARQRLKKFVEKGQVEFQIQNAQDLSLPVNAYDAAFLCWFLEHVPDPQKVLNETIKRIKPGGLIYCSEVHNGTFFLDPYSPATLKYWFEFNDYQWSIQGHPFVGAKLGNLLLNAGFTKIETFVRTFHFDSRNPKTRKEFIAYFTELLLSAAPGLLKAKRVTPKLVKEMKVELKTLATAKDSVFYYSFLQARALKPKASKN